MSGIFGSDKSQSAVPQRYNAIQISSSASGGCLPLVYGQQRLPFNLVWYGDFTSAPTSDNSGKGGGGQTTGYNYSAAFICAICEGPVGGILQVWSDKDQTTLTALNFTQVTEGNSGQAIWSFLTDNFPTQAIPYDHVCYVGTPSYFLGTSASMPDITFEIQGLLVLPGTSLTFTSPPSAGDTAATLTSAVLATGVWFVTFSDYEVRQCNVNGTAVSWTGGLNAAGVNSSVVMTTQGYGGIHLDANPAAVIVDYLTDPNHGVGFPSSQIATLSGNNSYYSYCQTTGLCLSPYESTQRAASDFITEILQITNSDAVWSSGVLKIVPYCDTPTYGNGAYYIPNLTPQYIFTDDDYLEAPELTRKAITDTYNHVRVEYLDRSNQYNTAIAEASDIGDIAVNGERVMDTLSFHEITNSTTAGIAAQLILQTSLYERNTIKFKVRSDYCLLEPMDYIGINDSNLGYTNQVFRVTRVSDSDKDELELEAMEVPGTVRNAAVYNWSAVQGYTANYATAPGSVQAPAFMEAYEALVDPSGGRELWIAVCGGSASPSWGGCNVYLSFDNATYTLVGTATGATYGTISSNLGAVADPDTTSTLGVALNNTNATLATFTQNDADNNRSLISIDTGASTEILSYETATLVSSGNYNLTYFRRGQYSTTSQAHSAGAQFMRLDNNLFKLTLDPGYIGTELYFKFTSFNIYGRATEQLSAVTAYNYTPGQSATAYNTSSPSAFIASGNAAGFSATSAFKASSGAQSWDSSIYSSQAFTSCTIQCSPSQTAYSLGGVMIGLTTNPTASNNPFLNLQYAWYSTADLEIVEGTSTILTGITPYNTSSQMKLVYDGQSVQYYINGFLVRSVPIANQTFYMQICFYLPATSVYNISCFASAAATTNFTLVPLSRNVACAGFTVSPNGQGTNSTWGIRNFESAQAYSNGTTLSFSPIVKSVGYFWIGFSSATATGGTAPGANSTFSWYMNGGANTQCLVGTTIMYTVSGGCAATDVYTLTYDNYTAYWYKNGILVYTYYLRVTSGSFHLFGDIYDQGTGFTNISFEPYGQLSPNPFVATGYCTVHDSSAHKIGDPTDPAWDSAVYSLNAYSGCHVSFKSSYPGYDFMMGLSVPSNLPTATGSSSYTNLDHAWYAQGGGVWIVYELGTPVYTSTNTVDANDVALIIYDGSNVVYYYLNGQLLHSTTGVGVVPLFYLNSSFASNGAQVGSMEFGPGTAADIINPVSQVAAKGNIPPTLLGESFSYGSTTTSVTISWSASTLYRADGSTTAVASGSITVTGLSVFTNYRVYPYISDAANANVVLFVTGGSGSNGSPAICYTYPGNAIAAQTQNLQGNIGCGAFTVSTPSSGSGSGSGGGFACLHPSQRLTLANGTEVFAEDLKVGDKVLAPDDKGLVTEIARPYGYVWHKIRFHSGLSIFVTPEHRMYTPDMTMVKAHELKLGSILAADGYENLEVVSLELVRETQRIVKLDIQEPHLYYVGKNGPLSHNIAYKP